LPVNASYQLLLAGWGARKCENSVIFKNTAFICSLSVVVAQMLIISDCQGMYHHLEPALKIIPPSRVKDFNVIFLGSNHERGV
jgi:hypothetical protein